jgi:predicted Zn-ribbon and HTH transcriptional regulator
MVKNHKLALAISDASWSELIRQIAYKCEWYGRELIKIDRWFPSSKRCGNCGHVVDKLPLNIREWKCPKCGTEHDRDINAAKNILAAGLAVERLWSNHKTRREQISEGWCPEAETQLVMIGNPRSFRTGWMSTIRFCATRSIPAPIAPSGVLPAAADAPNTAPEARKQRGRAFDVFIGLFGSIARGYLNNRQQVRIATKIQNPKPKTAQPQYDRSS